jgi:UDP-N-acetylmuramoyl-tripeptide--D-alanyl-D-alanine ligase
LAAFGRHNIYNALGAVSLAVILGMDIDEIISGLGRFQPFRGRGRILHLHGPFHILDDSYNSNPDSLEATLTAFDEMKGKSRGLAVLGDMLELGVATEEIHEKAGKRVGELGFAHLFFLGEQRERLAEGARSAGMDESRLHAAKNHEEILQRLEDLLEEGDWILVKGSRRMGMEIIVNGLIGRLGEKKDTRPSGATSSKG